MDGWNTFSFPFGAFRSIFRGELAVSFRCFRECSGGFQPKPSILPLLGEGGRSQGIQFVGKEAYKLLIKLDKSKVWGPERGDIGMPFQFFYLILQGITGSN